MADPTKPKHLITCCGYMVAQGISQSWECPGCHTVHQPPADDSGPGEYTPLPPPGVPLGAPRVQQALQGRL